MLLTQYPGITLHLQLVVWVFFCCIYNFRNPESSDFDLSCCSVGEKILSMCACVRAGLWVCVCLKGWSLSLSISSYSSGIKYPSDTLTQNHQSSDTQTASHLAAIWTTDCRHIMYNGLSKNNLLMCLSLICTHTLCSANSIFTVSVVFFC